MYHDYSDFSVAGPPMVNLNPSGTSNYDISIFFSGSNVSGGNSGSGAGGADTSTPSFSPTPSVVKGL